jgi:oligopeptide transport system ATP-binding protein
MTLTIEVNDLRVRFPVHGSPIFKRNIEYFTAVDGVSFSIEAGKTLGLVGESGCGKTTVGKAVIQLIKPTGGRVKFEDIDLVNLRAGEMRSIRRKMQMIFQDSYASLSPRMTVEKIVSEPLTIHTPLTRIDRRERVLELLEIVGLKKNAIDLFPHEFSGGQRQRIGIARAIALRPKFIVCDEPVSALDVSIQAQIINLLKDLQQNFALTYLFVSHDLAVVRHISDQVAVMYSGKLVELTDNKSLYSEPLHPYTKALLSAVPVPDPDEEQLRANSWQPLLGDLGEASSTASGCRFFSRCRMSDVVSKQHKIDCRTIEPAFVDVGNDHWLACHLNSKCHPT